MIDAGTLREFADDLVGAGVAPEAVVGGDWPERLCEAADRLDALQHERTELLGDIIAAATWIETGGDPAMAAHKLRESWQQHVGIRSPEIPDPPS